MYPVFGGTVEFGEFFGDDLDGLKIKLQGYLDNRILFLYLFSEPTHTHFFSSNIFLYYNFIYYWSAVIIIDFSSLFMHL